MACAGRPASASLADHFGIITTEKFLFHIAYILPISTLIRYEALWHGAQRAVSSKGLLSPWVPSIMRSFEVVGT